MSVWMLNGIVIVFSKETVFDYVDLVSNLGFGNGSCEHLLAVSKVLMLSRNLLTKELSSFLGNFNSSGRT